jgi:hypothetical protein
VTNDFFEVVYLVFEFNDNFAFDIKIDDWFVDNLFGFLCKAEGIDGLILEIRPTADAGDQQGHGVVANRVLKNPSQFRVFERHVQLRTLLQVVIRQNRNYFTELE